VEVNTNLMWCEGKYCRCALYWKFQVTYCLCVTWIAFAKVWFTE